MEADLEDRVLFAMTAHRLNPIWLDIHLERLDLAESIIVNYGGSRSARPWMKSDTSH